MTSTALSSVYWFNWLPISLDSCLSSNKADGEIITGFGLLTFATFFTNSFFITLPGFFPFGKFYFLRFCSILLKSSFGMLGLEILSGLVIVYEYSEVYIKLFSFKNI